MAPELFLASTSAYRSALLEKLAIPFKQIDPNYDELPLKGETAQDKALRLAKGKAEAAISLLPGTTASNAQILGSDQVAHMNDTMFSKPGNKQRAVDQLKQCSGQWVSFSTAVCLMKADGSVIDHFYDDFRLKFRRLSADLIDRYLELDKPYDCAGSIKAEASGILLIEETDGQDINTLYGLPLIRLTPLLTGE